jgi:scyllo-inositol 2-dehydrogenase (NADP+)
MVPSNDIRAAVIGFGLGGQVFHAPLIEATPGMRVASIVTRDPARREQARARYPAARLYDRADDVWAAADEHDLAVVVTPNRDHVPLALAALDAGLPVVIDKPIAATVAEAEQVVVHARERGLLLSVFQNRRWDSDFLTVRRLLADDVLGPILRFESRFERWQPERKPEAWRESSDPAEGGGLLLDLGSHLIDQAMLLFGPPVEVYAETERRRPGAGVDDDTFVALRHPGGERSHLWMSSMARLPGPRMRVVGSRGAFESFELDAQEPALRQGAVPDERGWVRQWAERWGTLATEEGERQIEPEPGDYLAYYAGIVRALQDGELPPVDPEDSIAGLHVIEAAFRSALDGSVEVMRWDRGGTDG